MKAPERIRVWVEAHFNPKYADRVFADLIDVATGTREGNSYECWAISQIFPEWNRDDSQEKGGA